MHHRKGGFSHGLKRKGFGTKHRGHAGHGGHHKDHRGIFESKGHKPKGGHHAYHSEHGESIRGSEKVLDFHGRDRSHPMETGEQHYQGRSGAKVDVNLDQCVLCGKCMRVCPTEAIMVTEESIRIDVDKCMGCGHCVERCKNGALFLVEGKEAVTN